MVDATLSGLLLNHFGVISSGCDYDRLRVCPYLSYRLRRLEPIHLRQHIDVHEYKIEWRLCITYLLYGLLPVVSRLYQLDYLVVLEL